MSFIQRSKYRHIFGTVRKNENCYHQLRVSRTAWDTNYVVANTKYWAMLWDQAGGGAFAVWPHEKTGKLANIPLFSGHTSAVLDLAFNPFDDSLIASASEDTHIKLWKIPDGGNTEPVTECLQDFRGHQRKVGGVMFHPTASSVLASHSPDNTVRLWDITNGEEKYKIGGYGDMIQSFGWNYDGSQMVTSSKDKMLRIVDPRSSSIAAECESFPGIKGSRALWAGKRDMIFGVGFSKTSDRVMKLWDTRKFDTHIHSVNIDTSSGIIMPFFDEDTNVIYLAGKGDGNIRYYEIMDEKPFLYALSEFKSGTPQKGMAICPKGMVDVASCEVTRLLKLTKTDLEPIEMRVPRKSDAFQEDIFPPTRLNEASLTHEEWFAGKNAEPKLTSLEGGFQAAAAASVSITKSEGVPSGSGSPAVAEVETLKAKLAEKEEEVTSLQDTVDELEVKLEDALKQIAELKLAAGGGEAEAEPAAEEEEEEKPKEE